MSRPDDRFEEGAIVALLVALALALLVDWSGCAQGPGKPATAPQAPAAARQCVELPALMP